MSTFRNFEEFWPFYLREHSKPATRWLHFVGTTIGMIVAAFGAATGRWWLIPLGFVPGYAFSWVSHFFIESNRPASFKNPLWSFRGDMRMWALIVTGKIHGEVARHVTG